jgi:DNA helicase-2/ATP-dependent DNA helicase PcrA
VLTSRHVLADAASRLSPGEFSSRDLDQVCRWCSRQSDDICTGETPDEDQEHIAADGRIETEYDPPGRLDPADDPLLLYLTLLKRGRLRTAKVKPLEYAHLVVDEAQDLSAIEIKVLVATTSPQHSVTLAGDTAQRLVFDNAFSSWESLLMHLDMPVAANSTLKLGYRSTQEVMALARSLLEHDEALAPQESVRRGAPVELHRFNDQGEAVAMIAEALRSLVQREPVASTILITRHPSQARLYAEALVRAEVPNLRLVREQDFSFRPGIEVADVAQVKGLEFDYVILLDVTAGNYPNTRESRHLLHIAATRAAHQLWLINVGAPSPLLPRTL